MVRKKSDREEWCICQCLPVNKGAEQKFVLFSFCLYLALFPILCLGVTLPWEPYVQGIEPGSLAGKICVHPFEVSISLAT